MAQVDWQGQSGRRLCTSTSTRRPLTNTQPASVSRTTASYEFSPALTERTARTRPVRASTAWRTGASSSSQSVWRTLPSEGPQTQLGEAEPAAILATPEVSSRLGRGTRPVRSGLNHVTHRHLELDGYADFVTGTRGTRWAWTGRRRAWRACTTTTSADASASQEERGEHDSLRIPNGYGYTVRRFRAAPPRRP